MRSESAMPLSLPCGLLLSVDKEARFEGEEEGFLVSEGDVRLLLASTGVVLIAPSDSWCTRTNSILNLFK